MEWVIGVFTVMAVMAAIIGGMTGIRLMYIDMEYKKMILNFERRRETPTHIWKQKRSPTGLLPKNGSAQDGRRERRKRYERELSDIRTKRDANRLNVIIDGICIGIILFIALRMALGFSSSLLISVVWASTFFVVATVTFYYHALNVSRNISN